MNFRSVRLGFASLSLATAVSTWWGCDAAPMNTFTSSSTSTGTGGAGGAGGAGMSTGSMGDGGSDIHVDGGMGDADMHLDDASVCSASTAQATLTPLDMIVLLDESGSMSGTKWTTVTAALKAFFNDPKSAGIGAGIVYFPNFQADDCVWNDYANLDVPIGTLPGNAAVLNASIDANMPQGATPTYGALKGALHAATSYQDAHSDHKVIVVFATDGDPTECTITDTPTIAALAKTARNYNGVQTYVIAVPGSTISNLDPIAVAGGTTKAYDVTTDISQFAQKMADIRANALACEFAIPPPPAHEMLDPHKVNVDYTPGGSTMATTLPNVTSAAQCGNHPGWYYDDSANPKKIELCPAACQQVKSDSMATISVAFGCKTIAM